MAKRKQQNNKRRQARAEANKKAKSWEILNSLEARKIAEAFPDMDERKAYIAALLEEWKDVNPIAGHGQFIAG